MLTDLIGLFSAGSLSLLTPCVLPLIPIYLSALVGGDVRGLQAGGKRHLMVRAGLFSIGFILVFTLLGLTASSLGRLLGEHRAGLTAFGAGLIFLFALRFLGLIRIPWLDRTLRADDRKLETRSGAANALIMGIVFAAGWSPCVGPVLGAVLTYTASATTDPATGALYLAVYGLGFASPLLLMAAFAQAVMGWIQRLGKHLRLVERVLGVGLLVVAVSMAIDVAPQLMASREDRSQQALPAVSQSSEGSPTMLAFTSPSCTICKRMEPVLADLITECDGKSVEVERIDLSEPDNRELARSYRLVGVPTYVFQDSDGQEVARLVGEQSPGSLKRALSALRGEPCPGLALLDDEGLHEHPANELAPSKTCQSGWQAEQESTNNPTNQESCEGV
jgi:cytochrome c-type biogenesis protein